ncbi:MAG: hypothetical protein M0R40_03340 [Firmicutes bacterium]|nr:hypothetical protein [Bacillota bacterium]
MKKKALVLLVVLSMLITFLPIVNVTAEPVVTGQKSENFNLSTASYARHVTIGNDMRGNDGDIGSSLNHTNRPAGEENTVVFDLKTLWTKSGNGAVKADGVPVIAETRDTVPTYNKIVYHVNKWNATDFSLFHSDTADVSSPNQPKVENPSAVKTWELNLNRDLMVETGENATPTSLVFSFDATNNRYIGSKFLHMLAHNANGSGGYYTAYSREYEVFYVTPESLSVVSEQDIYVVAPNDTIADNKVKAKIFDVDGDEILDSNLTGVRYSTNAENATIDPDTGVITIGSGLADTETFTVSAVSTVPGCEGLSGSTEVTIVNANDPSLPIGVEITTEEKVYDLDANDTFTVTGGAKNIDGHFITDSEVTDHLKWSIETDSSQFSIDPDTGIITLDGYITDAHSVKIILTLGGGYNFSASANLVFKSVKKSLNYNLNSTAFSPWNVPVMANDGNYATTSNGGNHSAGGWRFGFGLSNWAEPKPYNKAVVHYTQYNTEYLEFYTGTSQSGTDASGGIDKITIDNINADFETQGMPMKQIFSFDAVNHPYIVFVNRYLRPTHINDSSQADYKYFGKNPTISEVELFHVLPAGVEINAEDAYTADANDQIELSASILDIDGDAILDNSFSGINWTVEGSDKVSIDSSTGVLTVNESPNGAVTVKAEMTAAGYDYYAEKEILITTSNISSIEISDLPDFIMTNKEQDSKVTFYPSAVAYGYQGEELSGQSFVWSLKEQVNGVEVIDASYGAFTVKSNAPEGQFTLVCKPADENESASGEITISLNRKVDIVQDKIGWVQNGWQVKGGHEVGYAVDGDSDTCWDSGNHSRGASVGLFDIGEIANANYFRLKLGNIDNSTSLRIAGSDELKNNAGETVDAPTKANLEFADSPRLVPRDGGAAIQGRTFWSARSESAAIESNYEQDNIITSYEIADYFKNGMEEFRYIGVVNYAKDITDNAGRFTVYDFEVYNTAPNYVSIDLPDEIDITTNAAAVNMKALIHNGVAPEGEAIGGSWSAVGFNISANGELNVASSSAFVIGTITYSYASDNLDAETTVYVCNDNGTLKFANNPGEFLNLKFAEGIRAEGNTLYIPEGMDVAQIVEGITSDKVIIDDIFVVEGGSNIIESGSMLDSYDIWIFYGDITLIYNVAYGSDTKVSITNEESDYTASIKLREDTENAVLVFAEYDGNKIVRLETVKKTQEIEQLSLTFESVASGNTVKAILLKTLEKLQPLRDVEAK